MASPQNLPAAPQSNLADTPATPSLNWRYPFPARDGKEITDPQIFYGALSAMSDGFFPLGVNGFPHGGIHFGAASSSRIDQSKGVRVIADGDIVAFKIDDAYPHLHYTQTRHWAWYSRGFVLVRHTMTMPRAPGSTGAQPADETLTFFSLYMHMADWATYLSDCKLVRPDWWPGVDVFRIGTKDTQIGGGAPGAMVYTAPTAGKKKNTFTAGQQVGFLPADSEVTISETRGTWGHIKAIMSGTMAAPKSGDYFGWEDGPQAPWLQPDGTQSADKSGDVRDPGDSNRSQTPLTAEGDWGWINLHDQQALKEPTSGVGTVFIPPKTQPIHVTAGTLLGQIGEYIDYETSTPLPPKLPTKQLLHLEVFADESLKAFIDKSRARAAQLPVNDRTIFVIQAGAKLVPRPTDADLTLGSGIQLAKLTETTTSPKTGPWIQVQPWINSPSGHPQQYQNPVWIARSGLSQLNSPSGQKAWKSFPLQLSQVGTPVNADLVTYPSTELNALGNGNVAVDDKGVSWWHLEVGTGSGQSALGWVCGGKQSDGSGIHPGTQWASPWAWPGFEIVDATGINLTDAFKRNLSVTGSASPKEQKAFAPSTQAVGNSALLSKLEQTVSRLPSPGGAKDPHGKDGSVVVTAVKLRQALTRPWLASDLGHVILKYESEWGGGMSRWEAITPLMRNAAENWKCELERIKNLQWWDSVKGKVDGFPSAPTVNHIHPVALIGNFTCACGCINVDNFISLYATQHQNFSAGTQPLDDQSKENLQQYLRLLLDYYRKFKSGECNIPYLAYILATARLETATYHKDIKKTIYFAPIAESGPIPYFNKYDPVLASTQKLRERARSMENTQQGDGYKYRGRGYVQLTWKKLYRLTGEALVVDLVNNPDEAMDPRVAASIAAYGMDVGLFTGKKLSDYISDEHQDYVNARRIINGLDRAQDVAGFAVRFKEILESSKC
ncbi:lytic transglycosylase domain-containing protein [Paraburkholderia bannensis]|uniref:lytic transglycosylase domain-containing protein n=1 Tax=Paraburkholderia bannensis TaxID=765414 RepID=UPI002AB688FA|nr:lytic transglycosylase domain-containing protein [Paraburkholderia bannensis]